MSDGSASNATKFLNTASVPELHHWMDEGWIERLYRLSQYGVKPEAFMAWAHLVAAGADDEPDNVDVVEPVDQSALTQTEAVASPVVAILGRPLIPKKAKWSDPSWVRSLFDLQFRGVELAAFQAWAREASDAAIKATLPPEPADVESSGPSTEASFCSAAGSTRERARMAYYDPLSFEPDPEVVDGPPPPAAYVEVVIDVRGRKRAPESRSDVEGDCGTSQQGRRRRSGKSPE